MNYGYYDNQNREYVITRPDTPTPWMNYLGNGGFSGLISNTGGGLVFYKDASNHRITRYRFNEVPADRPGRYLYLRDMQDGEYWSPSWQPVQKELDSYECRHGYGYTKIKGAYKGVETKITYFIPLGKKYELWKVEVKNLTETERNLRAFTYMEFASYQAQYDRDGDWPRYFMTGFREGNAVVFDPSNDWIQVQERLSFIGTNIEIAGYDCERDAFIGRYRSESNPIVVERGTCGNTEINADNCCGTVSMDIPLQALETKVFYIVVGITDEVMNNWGANHGAISYGHIGADLITLCSMLRIPVCMHNVPTEKIFRPAAWNAFGMDKEGADYRACETYGPFYK